jgi:hypothetical protein
VGMVGEEAPESAGEERWSLARGELGAAAGGAARRQVELVSASVKAGGPAWTLLRLDSDWSPYGELLPLIGGVAVKREPKPPRSPAPAGSPPKPEPKLRAELVEKSRRGGPAGAAEGTNLPPRAEDQSLSSMYRS